MAFDPELVSAYFDDEIPSPWKERAADQIQADQESRALLASFEKLRSDIREDRERLESELPALEARVFERISETRNALGSQRPRKGFWKSTVSIPAPAAAAAALVLFFGLGFTLAVNLTSQPRDPLGFPEISAVSSFGLPVGVGTSDPMQTLQTSRLNGMPLTEDQIRLLQQLYSNGAVVGGSQGQTQNQSPNQVQGQIPGQTSGQPSGVTITLQDVSQLLQLLQGAASIREFSIDIPENRTLELIGEPALLRGSSRTSTEHLEGAESRQ